MDCIFCKIAKKELPSEIIFEDEKFVAFKDISPKAEFHILIIPKVHINSIADLQESDKELAGELILTAQKIAKEKKLEGYKLLFNVGLQAGQTVEHIHLHLLSGKNIEIHKI